MYTHPLYHWPPKSRWVDWPTRNYNWSHTVAYVHFPFCRNICDFCGYETRLIDKPSVTSFGPSLLRQIDKVLDASNIENLDLDAIFFGGGTASLMPTEHLCQITERLLELAPAGKEVEVTLECEPGTISKRALRSAKNAGVNRISVCSQSLDDRILKSIGRKHSSDASYKLIEDCMSLGFTNIHVDLIYGLPGQSIEDWQKTVELVAALPVQHVSAYKLYVYKHGQLHRDAVVQRPEFELDPQTKRTREMHDLAVQIFNDADLQQYSLTEFSKTGMECRYVTACFDGSDVLPIGPSAFGRCGSEVWDNSPYAHLFEQADFGCEHDRARVLSPYEAFKRDVLLGFWLLSVDVEALSSKHLVVPSDRLVGLLNSLSEDGWIEFDGQTIRLKRHQRFLAGFPMERLAALNDEDWCEGTRSDCTSGFKKPASKITQRRLELNFLIRMARRDPKFFLEVNSGPFEALEKVGFQGGSAEVKMLVNAISNQATDELTDEEIQLRELWKLVEKEHLRSLKAQKIAGLK